MTKISKKSEKTNPFGGIFHVREQFSRHVGPIIHINFYVIAFFLSPPPQTKKAPPRCLFKSLSILGKRKIFCFYIVKLVKEPTMSPIIAPYIFGDFIFLYTIRDVTLQQNTRICEPLHQMYGLRLVDNDFEWSR